MNRELPFLDLKSQFEEHRDLFLDAISKVFEDATFVHGPDVADFEREFATYVGPNRHVVGCANGTDAITIAARALNLPPGSEAIVPAMTYVASAAALIHAGIKVRLVDVLDGTYLVDPRAMEKAITKQTRLLVPVHLYGQMPAMDEIRALADRHGCLVLEDAAQAQGALWKREGPGRWGHVATYSFYPGKNLGAYGDAGAILSSDAKIVERCRALGNQGGLRKYEHEVVGYNSRLDSIQAAILRVKLQYLERWNEARRRIAQIYDRDLRGIEGLSLPSTAEDASHVYHLYVVLVEDRTTFMDYLKERGIPSGVHYPRALHQLSAFRSQPFARENFPVAERVAAHGVSLPICPTLTSSEIERIIQTVRNYFRR